MDTQFATEAARRLAAFHAQQDRIASIHGLINLLLVVVVIAVLVTLGVALARLLLACGRGLGHALSSLFQGQRRETVEDGFDRDDLRADDPLLPVVMALTQLLVLQAGGRQPIRVGGGRNSQRDAARASVRKCARQRHPVRPRGDLQTWAGERIPMDDLVLDLLKTI